MGYGNSKEPKIIAIDNQELRNEISGFSSQLEQRSD